MKIQILYPIFNLSEKQKKNLKMSVKSIENLNTKHEIEFCFSDLSPEKQDLSFLKVPFKRYHKPTSKVFPKSESVNIGFKKLINTNYFIMSDVDVIYPYDFIEKSLELVYYYKKSILWSTLGFKMRSDSLNEDLENHLLKVGIKKIYELVDIDEIKRFHAPSLFMRKNDFKTVGGWNEDLVFKGYGDHDFHFRLKMNGLIEFLPSKFFTYHLNHYDRVQYPIGSLKNYFIFMKYIMSYINNVENTKLGSYEKY